MRLLFASGAERLKSKVKPTLRIHLCFAGFVNADFFFLTDVAPHRDSEQPLLLKLHGSASAWSAQPGPALQRQRHPSCYVRAASSSSSFAAHTSVAFFKRLQEFDKQALVRNPSWRTRKLSVNFVGVSVLCESQHISCLKKLIILPWTFHVRDAFFCLRVFAI